MVSIIFTDYHSSNSPTPTDSNCTQTWFFGEKTKFGIFSSRSRLSTLKNKSGREAGRDIEYPRQVQQNNKTFTESHPYIYIGIYLNTGVLYIYR